MKLSARAASWAAVWASSSAARWAEVTPSVVAAAETATESMFVGDGRDAARRRRRPRCASCRR